MENFLLKCRKQASNTKKSLNAKTKNSNVQNALLIRVSNLKLTKGFLYGSPITLNLLKHQSLEQEGRFANGHRMGSDHRVLENYPGFGPDRNWAMIRPNWAHTPVFPDRNYRVWKAVRAHNSLDHGLIWSDQRSFRSGRSDHSLCSLDNGLGSVWSEVISVWMVWS